MGYFRNPEIRRELILYTVLLGIFSAVGFVFGAWQGIFVFGICAGFAAMHFSSSYRRYQKIRKLSQEIDAILHGSDTLNFEAYSEGELAILQTELQKMVMHIRETTAQLKKDKIWLTDSIADISHQLRTPLTAMNLIASTLSFTKLTDQRRMELTFDLKKLLLRIDWLVATLLKISKIDAGTAIFREESISVAELIQKAAEPLAIPMDIRGQKLTVEVHNEFFHGDLAWSAEAIGNILKNCMEHTPEDGRIEVTAEENAVFTQIVIRDTGSGIDKDDLPHLFERFYKGKNAGESSFGIGLALARMVVTAQNGTIKAQNHPDGGAVFSVRFYKGIV